MIRNILWNMLLLILPVLVYSGVKGLLRRTKGTTQPWNKKILPSLIFLGLFMVGVNLFLLSHYTTNPPASTYIPPAMIDGTVNPGYYEKKKEEK